ncbi:MAG: ATP-binding cassette domain-containing protein [Actinomycetia bacterium]|nr:ATP-binding cassette domain-containing protein [Actinomycetes bacterium]
MPHTDGPAPELFTLDVVTFVAGGRPILDGVSDHIHEGHVTAIVGPSGSGKSTLLRMLNRLEEPTSGRISFRGTPLPELDVRSLRRRVGMVAQRPAMLTGRIDDEVRVGELALTDADVDELLTRVALDHIERDRHPADLSGGEQQRLALARALAVGPEVLLLDEPTSALDRKAAQSVDSVIAGLAGMGLSVVLVSHDLQRAAALTHDALVLDHGQLVDRGDPAHVTYLGGA